MPVATFLPSEEQAIQLALRRASEDAPSKVVHISSVRHSEVIAEFDSDTPTAFIPFHSDPQTDGNEITT